MEQIIKTVDYKLERFWNLLITALPMGTTFRVWEFKNFFFFAQASSIRNNYYSVPTIWLLGSIIIIFRLLNWFLKYKA